MAVHPSAVSRSTETLATGTQPCKKADMTSRAMQLDLAHRREPTLARHRAQGWYHLQPLLGFASWACHDYGVLTVKLYFPSVLCVSTEVACQMTV